MEAMTVQRRPVLVGLAAAATLTVALGMGLGAPAQAQAKATSTQLHMEYSNGVKYKTTTFSVDLNGKGGKEKAKVVPISKRTKSGAKGIKVYVQGKKALTLNSKYASARFSLYYVKLSRSREYLAIGQPTSNPYTAGKLALYRYRKGKLTGVADLSRAWGRVGVPSEVTGIAKVTSDSVSVVYSYDKCLLGSQQFAITYKLDAKAGTWSLATRTASVRYAPKSWKATVTRKLYRDAAPAKMVSADGTTTVNPVVATMKKGAKVKSVRVSSAGYVQATLSNGKKGWFAWSKYKKGRPFKGVAGY